MTKTYLIDDYQVQFKPAVNCQTYPISRSFVAKVSCQAQAKLTVRYYLRLLLGIILIHCPLLLKAVVGHCVKLT